MTGKDRAHDASPEVSTGGSLISDAKLRQLYTNMVHCRLLSEYASTLDAGSMFVNPYAGSTGQEAIASGWVTDLRKADSIALASQDATPGLVKGVPLEELVAQLHSTDNDAFHPGSGGHHVIPASADCEEQFAAIVATAFTNKRKTKSPVVVSFVSQPVTSLPAWKDLLTKAGKRRLPIIFVVENNPWKGTLTGANDFMQMARSYGLIGIPVDGNDVVAIYRVAFESLDRVRHGDGPVMVEARTYREAGKKVPTKTERDPLIHMERYLKRKSLFTTKWKDELVAEFSLRLKRAAESLS